MPDQAIVIADPAGVIQVFNTGAERLFGQQAGNVIGQRLDALIPPEYRAHHWRGFNAAMAGDDLAIDRAAANVPILRGSGESARAAVRLLVLRDAKQQIVGAMAIFVADDDPASPLPRL